jgi:dienelactone hydrolase
MLAAALGARVVMPDFFEPGAAWDTARHPPQTDADKRAFQEFFAGPANPANAVQKLERVAHELRAEGARSVGAYGLCWGKQHFPSGLSRYRC